MNVCSTCFWSRNDQYGNLICSYGLPETGGVKWASVDPTDGCAFHSRDGSNLPNIYSRYHGTSAPSDAIGSDGDRYYNTSSGLYYSKISGAWVAE